MPYTESQMRRLKYQTMFVKDILRRVTDKLISDTKFPLEMDDDELGTYTALRVETIIWECLKEVKS